MAGLAMVIAAAVAAGASVSTALDPFATAVVAARRGYEAEARGDRHQAAAAAEALRASGARPVGTTRDLALRWAKAPTVERDRALGPAYREQTLRGGDTVIFEQTFLGGRRAQVAVVPRGNAEVALQIENGGRIQTCETSHRVASCTWMPSFSARVRIELHNPGKWPASYLIMLQ